MEFSVVGSQEFTLGFQLAGISNIFNPETEEEMASQFQVLCRDLHKCYGPRGLK